MIIVVSGWGNVAGVRPAVITSYSIHYTKLYDFDYYTSTHLPLVRDRLGDACHGVAADKGIAGGTPGAAPAYIAIAHLYFESVDAFNIV